MTLFIHVSRLPNLYFFSSIDNQLIIYTVYSVECLNKMYTHHTLEMRSLYQSDRYCSTTLRSCYKVAVTDVLQRTVNILNIYMFIVQNYIFKICLHIRMSLDILYICSLYFSVIFNLSFC